MCMQLAHITLSFPFLKTHIDNQEHFFITQQAAWRQTRDGNCSNGNFVKATFGDVTGCRGLIS